MYLHFPNMRELQAAIVARRLKDDLAAMRSAGGMAEMFAVFLNRSQASPILARALAAEPGYWVPMIRLFQDSIAAAVDRKEIARCDPAIVASAVYGALVAAIAHPYVGQPGEKRAQAVICVALRAVGYVDRVNAMAAAGIKAAAQ